MRRPILLAAFGAATVLLAAGPASGSPELPVHVNTDNGVAVYVGPQANPIVGAGVSDERGVCVVVGGFWGSCAP